MFGVNDLASRVNALSRTLDTLIKHLTDQGMPRALERIERALIQMEKIMPALDDLRAAVARDTDVTTSAVTLLRGIKAKLDAAIASGDPAALRQLSNDLNANTDAMAAAIVENTVTDDGTVPGTPEAIARAPLDENDPNNPDRTDHNPVHADHNNPANPGPAKNPTRPFSPRVS